MVTRNTGKNVMKSKKTPPSTGIFLLTCRLEDYDTLKPLIEDLKFEKNCKIINLGCGNAEFSEYMYDDGYKNIVNIDIAPNVIDYMKTRSKTRPEMTCKIYLLYC